MRWKQLRHLARFDANGRRLDRSDPQTRRYIQGLIDEMDAIGPNHLDAQEALVRVNDAYLPRMMATLPPEQADMLQRLYQIRSYPRVYPESFDPIRC